MKYETPLKLYISLPSDREYNQGETRRYRENGKTLTVRFHNSEIVKLQQAASILGIGRSSLIRHCAIKYAEALIKHRNEWIKEKANATKEPDPTG